MMVDREPCGALKKSWPRANPQNNSSFLIPNSHVASSLFQTFFWEVKPCLM